MKKARRTGVSDWLKPAGAPQHRSSHMEFYNQQYHHTTDEGRKELSNEIHRYLSRLHHLWEDIEKGNFTLEEVLQRFGDSIRMDYRLIDIYYRAHQSVHPEERFWQNLPTIVAEGKKLRQSEE